MRSERVARSEIVTAARENGHASMDSVTAVILEADGELSVLGQTDAVVLATLADVHGVPDAVPTRATAPEASGGG